ncbi:MAG: hypothetical protein NZ530_01130 [Thermodesulfobacteriaceae bacterium]|nr:hypothetical protein [Thermodesulfobacteriaceae bacterium]MCX8042289.1 hypothetical protein [Thermodesulfobacteriaceae bacterium]MDW8136629.1 hypothetical protein [Thermodesulfobacterium sp.]
MKSHFLKFIGFCFLNFSLTFPLQAQINYQVDDGFPTEYLEKIVNLATDIKIDLDIETSLNLDIPVNEVSQAVIVQIGNQNQAYQTQYGISNIALIYQEGNENYAFQKQEGNYNQAYIIQQGFNNYAYQEQLSNYNTAIVIQLGSNNQAYQYQGLHGGVGYKSTIIQQGNGNVATIYQY